MSAIDESELALKIKSLGETLGMHPDAIQSLAWKASNAQEGGRPGYWNRGEELAHDPAAAVRMILQEMLVARSSAAVAYATAFAQARLAQAHLPVHVQGIASFYFNEAIFAATDRMVRDVDIAALRDGDEIRAAVILEHERLFFICLFDRMESFRKHIQSQLPANAALRIGWQNLDHVTFVLDCATSVEARQIFERVY